MTPTGSATLGPLPPGWVWAQVKAVGDVKLGRQRSPEHHAGPHMRPYLRVANVYEDRLDLTDVKEMNFSPEEYEVFRLERGDVLLNEGQSPHLVGRPAIWRGEVPGTCFQNTLIRFRARAGVVPGFALTVFRAQMHLLRFVKIAQITTNIAHLSVGRFAEVEFPLPPTAEQQRIVAEIEKQFTRLDEAVATLKAVQAKLKRARASVLKAAVDGRLVPTEAELARAEGRSYEPASALLERILAERRSRWPEGKKYQPPAEPKTDDLPELPEGWGWATLEAAAEVVGGITKNKRTERGREVPYLRVANVQRGRLDLSHVKSIVATEAVIAELRLVPGDILLNEGGDRDKLGRGWVWEGQLPECIHQNHVFRARVWLPSIRPKYVSHYANSLGRTYFLGEGKQTTNLASISLSKIKLLPLAVPPAAEQVRIVAEVERRLSVIDNLEHTVEQTLARCGRLRQSILKRAFEGKLVPQDPSDEPASRLLERLRAATDSTDRSSGKQASGSRRRPAASAGAGRRR